MMFRFLLYVLASRVRRALKRSEEMRMFLRNERFSLAVRANDVRFCREYVFADGQFSSMKGVGGPVDTEMVWESAKMATKALTGGEEGMLEALGRSQLTIKGNLENFFKFIDIIQA